MSGDGIEVDAAVLGLGTAGEAVSTGLARAGTRVVALEPGRVGGECPFTGCMPSKALLHDAVAGRTWEEARAHRDAVVEHLDDGTHADMVRDAGVELVRSRGRIVEPGVVEADDGRRWRADTVVLATGSEPVLPPIDGLDPARTLTSDDLLLLDELPDDVVLLGGGAIGCELATVLVGFGHRATIVEQEDHLLGGAVDSAVAELLADSLRDRGIEVRTGVALEAVDHGEDRTRLTLSDGDALDCGTLLVAAGRRPAWQGLGLEAVGIGVEDPPTVDDRYVVAGVPWLRAVGDLNGRSPWTHGANHEAGRLVALLTGDDPGPEVAHMASCVFTHPAVASVGRTAAAAIDDGHDVVIGTATYDDVARPETDRLGDGLVVVVADRDTGALLGVSGVGERVDEVIGTAAALLHCGADLRAAVGLVLPFPTVTQVLTPAFADALSALDG